MVLSLALVVFDRIGESDCETIGQGVLAQPANTISSAAYVVAGLWLVSQAIRDRAIEKMTLLLYGLTLMWVGVGSIAFHGPQPGWARLMHDLSIAAAIVLIASRGIGTLRRWPEAAVIAVAAATTLIVGVVMTLSPEVGIALTAIVGLVAVAVEFVLFRKEQQRSLAKPIVRWLMAMGGLLVIAGAINVLGRTDGPLCDPDSILQGHALWHLLTAAAFALYGYATFETPEHDSARVA